MRIGKRGKNMTRKKRTKDEREGKK